MDALRLCYESVFLLDDILYLWTLSHRLFGCCIDYLERDLMWIKLSPLLFWFLFNTQALVCIIVESMNINALSQMIFESQRAARGSFPSFCFLYFYACVSKINWRASDWILMLNCLDAVSSRQNLTTRLSTVQPCFSLHLKPAVSNWPAGHRSVRETPAHLQHPALKRSPRYHVPVVVIRGLWCRSRGRTALWWSLRSWRPRWAQTAYQTTCDLTSENLQTHKERHISSQQQFNNSQRHNRKVES